MKIKKLKIQNFKVFDNIEFDFESSNLIIFDGPNGFGKTSVYDAIELLFTGRIRRFLSLDNVVNDRRQAYSEHPFLCDYKDGDIIITLNFSLNDTEYILERYAGKETLPKTISFNEYKLYYKESFESIDKVLVENEEQYLNPILGENYKENFQFLNYIEQEESLFLLKSKDSERKNKIAHLFNTSEFDHKISRIDLIKRKIEELCTNAINENNTKLEAEVIAIENFLKSEFQNAEFIKLFPEKNFNWDIQEFNFTELSYNSLFDSSGIFTRIKTIVENRLDYKNYHKNEVISKLILNENQLKNFFLYYNYITAKESFRVQKINFEKKEKVLRSIIDFSIKNIKTNTFITDLEDLEFSNNELLELFKSGIKSLEVKVDELSNLESIYSNIRESREKLIDYIREMKEKEFESAGICFLCGYDWSNIDELIKNITNESQRLEKINSEKQINFDNEFSKFKESVIFKIVEELNKELSDNKIDIVYINNLLAQDPVQVNNIKKEFENINFNFDEFLNSTATIEHSINIDEIKTKLNLLKKDYSLDNIHPYYNEYFEQYFDNNFTLLESIELNHINQKLNYLKYKYSTIQNALLINKKEELKNRKDKFKSATALVTELNKLLRIYKKSLKQFQRKVIKDIEIIFHIYSGRILQDFQGGLGLFIFSEKDGIRFQTNPTKTFDAIFSMSSGQLSALIISFTLALHKKYSKNKIILIDDPIQTMDEISMVGFVELLRNEFSQNQIFISTHEDTASIYMRYKFKNYGLSQKHINLKSYKD